MDDRGRWSVAARSILAHPVEAAFAMVATTWLWYVLRITRGFYFWADDLFLIEQAGTFGGLFEPYNDHLSLVILSIYRVGAEVGDLAYWPFMLAGALSLLAGPAVYFATARRQLGPLLAGVLAMPLLWYDGMNLRPSGLNHYLVLTGAVVCAAALNRGRRADGFLAGGLVLALCSAGGGVVVAGACLAHNLLVRAHRRRWLAVLIPTGLWAIWWVTAAGGDVLRAGRALSRSEAARVVRDLCLSPFYDVGFGNRALAWALMAGFALYGVAQLRRGLAAGANFLVWTGAMVAWALALVQSRGVLASAGEFRYAFLSLGFALLAVVPGRPMSVPAIRVATPATRAWLAAVPLLAIAAVSAFSVRAGLQQFAEGQTVRGREAKGTLLAIGLGPDVIPDDRELSLFGFFAIRGTAGQVRSLVDRYGSPYRAAPSAADQHLVDLGVVRTRVGAPHDQPTCSALDAPLLTPGVADQGAPPAAVSGGVPLELWSEGSFVVEVRRFGGVWVRVREVPAGRSVVVGLPRLNVEGWPWEVRADGACVVG